MIKKEEFYYDSRDGESRIHAVKWLPDCEKPIAVLQICHGMAEYIMRYEEFAQYMADKGVLVTGNDHLGHGLSKQNNSPYGYFCKRDAATVVVRDVHRLKKMVQEENPGVPYIILGHSMGSFVLRNYMAKYGSGIDGAIIVSTGYQAGLSLKISNMLIGVQKLFLGGKHEGHLADKITFGNYNSRIENPITKSDWLSVNRENVEKYIQDPLCGFTFTINGFETLGKLVSGAADETNMEKIPKELPILLLAGMEDPVGDYGKGVTTVRNKFLKHKIKKVDLKLYEGIRHEILNEDNRFQIFEDIYSHLQKNIV